MHRIVLCLYFGICTLMSFAVPAKRERRTLTLKDGSKVEATFMGDEMLHFYKTDDGRCLQRDSLGIAYFVEADVLQNQWKAKIERRQAARASKKGVKGQKQPSKAPMIGSKKGLVILVQFPGTLFHYDTSTFERLFNEIGYTDGINFGSVRDYYSSASYGQFDFCFDVVGPVTVSQPLSYYGSNDSYGDDNYPATMVSEAVKKVDDEVDFSKYDWDGDGEIEQIFVIHSGYDEAQTQRKTDIWSHAWMLSDAVNYGDGKGSVNVDGVIVDNYATCSELQGVNGTTITGVGTACHEFSHCFGLPDFYDTQGRNFGMDAWDIMDYGCYNGDGGKPAGFTSYERMFCGWLDPIELKEPRAVMNMPALTSEPVAYILRNSGQANEYYLLENRQKEGWDGGLAGHGMLVLHVDYDSRRWAFNTVNTDKSHQRMTIIPADNMLYSSSLSGDPWPGTRNKTELSDTSTPAATLYNQNAEEDKLMHHSFTEITESADGLISFIFDEEALGIGATLDDNGKMTNGEYYDLSGRKIGAGEALKKGIYIVKQGSAKANGKKIILR